MRASSRPPSSASRRSVLVRPEIIKMGYDFRDFDLRIAMTWKYLRGATVAEIEAHHSNALASDNKLVNTNILKALLNNVSGLNDEGNTVYPLYNGDSMVPPTSGFNTHTAPHNHYLTSPRRRTARISTTWSRTSSTTAT